MSRPVAIRDGSRRGVRGWLVSCDDCGQRFTIRPRTMREQRAQQRQPRCEACRFERPRPDSRGLVHVTQELRDWWLAPPPNGAGWTRDQCIEIGGLLDDWLADLVRRTRPATRPRAA